MADEGRFTLTLIILLSATWRTRWCSTWIMGALPAYWEVQHSGCDGASPGWKPEWQVTWLCLTGVGHSRHYSRFLEAARSDCTLPPRAVLSPECPPCQWERQQTAERGNEMIKATYELTSLSKPSTYLHLHQQRWGTGAEAPATRHLLPHQGWD